MKVQVTSSKRTRGPKRMEMLLTESITFQLYRRFCRALTVCFSVHSAWRVRFRAVDNSRSNQPILGYECYGDVAANCTRKARKNQSQKGLATWKHCFQSNAAES